MSLRPPTAGTPSTATFESRIAVLEGGIVRAGVPTGVAATDTATLQAAIDAAEALVGIGGRTSQGVEIQLGPGDWPVNALTYLLGGWTMVGVGKYATILKQQSGIAGPVIGPNALAGTIEPIHFRNMGVSGFANQTSNVGGIQLRGSARASVKHCYIAGVNTFGIKVEGYGVATTGDAMYSIIEDNDIANLTRGAAHVQFSNASAGGSHPDRGRVKNNLFRSAWSDYTKTDGAITSGLAVLTSASGVFTAADVGKWLYVVGAGAGGTVPLAAKITAYTSATQVTLSNNASTTVSGATYRVAAGQIGVLVDTAITSAGALSADSLDIEGNTMQGVGIPYRVNTQNTMISGNSHEVTTTGETIVVDIIAGPANFPSSRVWVGPNSWATYGDSSKLVVNDSGSLTTWEGPTPGNGMTGGSTTWNVQFGLTGNQFSQDLITTGRLRSANASTSRPQVQLDAQPGSAVSPSTFYGMGRDNPEATYINGAAVKAKINGTDGNWLDDGSNNLVLAGGAKVKSGLGAPAYSAALGDFYFRTGTPSTANQRIYICTTAATATTGAWTGIV